jgi:hypothetical protein
VDLASKEYSEIISDRLSQRANGYSWSLLEPCSYKLSSACHEKEDAASVLVLDDG